MPNVGAALQALIAGLGGGAESLGTSLAQRADPSRALELLYKQKQIENMASEITKRAQEPEEPPNTTVDYTDPQHPRLLQYDRKLKTWSPLKVSEPATTPPETPRLGGGPPQDVSPPPQQQPTAQGRPVATPKPPIDPMDVRMQKEISDLVATGVPVEKANERVRLLHGQMPAPVPTNQFLTVADTSGGPPKILVGNSKGSPNLRDTGYNKPTTDGLGSGTPQQKASLDAGRRTLDSADRDAYAYEEKLLAKIHAGLPVGPNAIAGTIAAFGDPAAHHDIAPAAGGLLNMADPEYAKYYKSLTAAANAGMLISQRPSDVRMKKENFLAGVSTNPTEELIQQARQWRADMKAAFDAAAKAQGSAPAAKLGAPKPTAAKKDPLLDKYGLTPP